MITPVYKKQCLIFSQLIEDFCNHNKISVGFLNALKYQSTDMIGPFWNYLYKAPKLYLANSKTFLNYRKQLDIDFKNELLTDEEVFYFQQLSYKNKKIEEMLRQVLRFDYIIK